MKTLLNSHEDIGFARTSLLSADIVLASIFAGLALIFGLCSQSQGAAGDLDPLFDLDGKVTTDFATGSDACLDVAIQSDGKIIAAGAHGTPNPNNLADFALARYDPDGTLDSTFGIGGQVTNDFGYLDRINAVAIQPDGKIIAAGSVTDMNREPNFALARYDPNGSLDLTFGSGGLVITDFDPTAQFGAQANALAIQPDSKIIAAGVNNDPSNVSDFALARYNSDGNLDQSFGSAGLVSTDFNANSDDLATAVAVQQDGRIVAAGRSNAGAQTYPLFALARYNADGSLDPTFGSAGLVITDFGGSGDIVTGVLIQPDMKILASGLSSTSTGNFNFGLARYNPNGSLDPAFGSAGLVTTDYGGIDDVASAVALQSNGKIVVAGHTDAGGNMDFALARYSSTGNLDPTFGIGGLVRTDFTNTNAYDQAFSIVLQQDGKIVAAGTNGVDFALARYDVVLFTDDFEDGTLSSSWTYVKPSWTESGGDLIGTPIGKKAKAIATPAFSGCSVCNVEVTMETAGGILNKLKVFGWFQDKNNNIEIVMEEENDRWIVKQRTGGKVVAKMKASNTIVPNAFYDVIVTFDGSIFTLSVNGIPLASMPAAVLPNGTVGFEVKNTTGRFGSIVVY
jgi:uncharacterized delta-60 repeat protein